TRCTCAAPISPTRCRRVSSSPGPTTASCGESLICKRLKLIGFGRRSGGCADRAAVRILVCSNIEIGEGRRKPFSSRGGPLYHWGGHSRGERRATAGRLRAES